MSSPSSPQITPATETHYFPLTIDELSQLLNYKDYGCRTLEILHGNDAKINLLRYFDSMMVGICAQQRLLQEEQCKATTLLTELWSCGVESDLATLIDEFRQPITCPPSFDATAPDDVLFEDLPFLNPVLPPAESVHDWGYSPCDNCQQKAWTCNHGPDNLVPCDECDLWKKFCDHPGPRAGWTYCPCIACSIYVDHCEHEV